VEEEEEKTFENRPESKHDIYTITLFCSKYINIKNVSHGANKHRKDRVINLRSFILYIAFAMIKNKSRALRGGIATVRRTHGGVTAFVQCHTQAINTGNHRM
jgi:hypothetical protein